MCIINGKNGGCIKHEKIINFEMIENVVLMDILKSGQIITKLN